MAKRSKHMKIAGSQGPAKATGLDSFALRKPSSVSRDWLWGLILIVAIFLAYSPVWWAGFVWDDDMHLTANPCIVGPLGLKEIWTTKAASICPLVLTTFWAEYKLWGLNPLSYHLVNVLVHGLNGIVLWRVLRSMRIPGAWLGAALWALHPVMVESVAWITELKNTQSGLFFLVSILFFVKALEAGDFKRLREWDWNYPLTLLFAALAMASKSSTVILPVVLCLIAWWIEGQWNWRTFAKVAPIFFMAVAAGLLPFFTLDASVAGDTGPPWVRTWPERLVMAGDAVWFYLGKLLWPYPLVTFYPRWKIDVGNWFSYLPLVAVVIVLVVLWIKCKGWSRPWFFAFACFLAALVPVLGFVDNSFLHLSFVADHFQYLAAMGPLALAGAGLAWSADVFIPGKRWLQSALGAGVLLIFATLSWHQAWVYESQEKLWTYTLVWNPNCAPAHYNLGVALAQGGKLDEAISHYQKALQLKPDDARTHYNLAESLAQKGQLDEAIAHYESALRINPNYVKAINNLANLYVLKGRLDEAIIQFKDALTLSPLEANAHNNLGVVFAQQGKIAEATAQFEEAVRLKPDYADAKKNLARVGAAVKAAPVSK